MAYVDCHTHILPGLDDGPAGLEEALALARALVEIGFIRAVATPHCVEDFPSKAEILTGFAEFKGELARQQLPLEISFGAEYALEPNLPERLQAGELLTLNGSRFLLLESPAYQPLPPFMEELIFNLRLIGCYPILAHPERCAAFQQEPNRLCRLIRLGALTQVTVSSLTGAMGPSAARAASLLFSAGAVHILATDAHSSAGRLTEMAPALSWAEKLGGPGTAALMLSERPALILQDCLPALNEPDESVFVKDRRRFKRALFGADRRKGNLTSRNS